MAEDTVKAIIEALIFTSERPISIDQIKNILDSLEPSEIRALIEQMKAEYEQSNRGMRIVEVAGGFQMTTPAMLAPFLRKLYKQRRVERLSKPALETLAIIAYKQPVSKMEIETLRNVNVDGVMESLLEKSLIRITGRKKAPGRPFVFGTTRQFLEYFGLKSLEELPKLEDFSKLSPKAETEEEAAPAAQGSAQAEPAVKESADEVEPIA
ncbi:MAG TPA: SMC-Scp complex subunit ScpB [Patescibacteria group bacterium]|nr:SMC-Scp complex subunit ScpB [Patescibacteria group bacterium]